MSCVSARYENCIGRSYALIPVPGKKRKRRPEGIRPPYDISPFPMNWYHAQPDWMWLLYMCPLYDPPYRAVEEERPDDMQGRLTLF
jgi:hypothetical protein